MPFSDALIPGATYSRHDIAQYARRFGIAVAPVTQCLYPAPPETEVLFLNADNDVYFNAFAGNTVTMTGNANAHPANNWLADVGPTDFPTILWRRPGAQLFRCLGRVGRVGFDLAVPYFQWQIPDLPALEHAIQVFDDGTPAERATLRPDGYATFPAAVRALIDANLGLI